MIRILFATQEIADRLIPQRRNRDEGLERECVIKDNC